MGMMNGPMTSAMMIGGGLMLLLVLAVLLLSLVALVKYLRGAR
ncbi:hypothetical protein [uncultured Jannaschia sp.]|nr:hypothetical protein [uncultured Jannaschia sp.]